MAQKQQSDDYAEGLTKGGGAKDKGDYSPHAGLEAQQQQSEDYAKCVTKGGGANEKGDYARTPARWPRTSRVTNTPRG